jgi:menaquinone-dependent protoporphyrinogen oxidase
MTVLVAAASKHGATAEIAARIGADLTAGGLDVAVMKLRDVEDVSRYEAVVVGSAVYFGQWMREARTFVDTHAQELAERPVWLFASGSIVGNPPPDDDPKRDPPCSREVTRLLDASPRAQAVRWEARQQKA